MSMREELREICKREIRRFNDMSLEGKLGSEDYANLQKMIASLKNLEDSSTPEEDELGALMGTASMEDLWAILDATEEA